MEVVGSVASIAQLIEIAAKVSNYCAVILGASKMIDNLGRESSMMLQLLYQVKEQVDSGISSSQGHPLGPEGLVRELQSCMNDLADQFGKLGSKSFVAKLRFAHAEKDIQKTIEKASRMNAYLTSWMTLDIRQTAKSIDDGVKVLHGHAEEEILNGKIDRIVEYFAPFSFSEKHSNAVQTRQEGTGQWFLDSLEFQGWLQSSGGALWCSGAPGAGKTVMVSTIIEHLREKIKGDVRSNLAFVYCDYRQRQDQKAWILLGNLWAQLFRRRRPSITEVDQIFGEMMARRDIRPTRTQIINMIRDELTTGNLGRTYIVVDALDECNDENERNTFIDSLHGLQPRVNVLVTSRTTCHEDGTLNDVRSFRLIPTSEDMGVYISARLRREKKMSNNLKRRPELEDEIRRVVVKRANGMFLLCKMHMDSLSKTRTVKDLSNELQRIPKGENVVKDTYDQAMDRIRNQGDSIAAFAMQVIRWVCFSRRPLKLAELLCALAVSPEDEYLDEDAVGDESDITNYCAGLVIVEGDSQTVRFVHYTTQEYFNSLKDTDGFVHSHGDIALTCISFLRLNDLSISKDGYVAQIWPQLQETPFLAYAALYFGYHCNQELIVMGSREYETSDDTMGLLLEFLRNPEHVQRAASMVFSHIGGRVSSLAWHPDLRKQLPNRSTAVDMAAFFNMICNNGDNRPFGVSLDWLIENTQQLTGPNEAPFGNPLHWASFADSVDSVEVLLSCSRLQLDVNAPVVLPSGWKPAEFSVAQGSLGTLQVLLNHGVDIYEPTGHEWRTSLLEEAIMWAHMAKGPDKTAMIDAIMQKDKTRELLLKRDVFMSTALIEAAMLQCDREGRTALHWAVADSSLAFKNTGKTTSGPAQVLEALLDGPHAHNLLRTCDVRGDTPFMAAVRRGHIQAVETIITKNYQHDYVNFSPSQLVSGLNLAAEVAEPSMVDLLLNHITSDLLNHPGEGSVLHYAARGNKTQNMNFLLQKLSELHLYNIPGYKGNSPLHYAAASGNVDAASALLRQKGILVDSQNEAGQTALHLAAGNNLIDVCSTLLKAGADVDIQDINGFTPLYIAIRKRFAEVLMNMLNYYPLKLNKLDPNDVAWVQRQPWGHNMPRASDSSSEPNLDAGPWPKDEADIITAALCLRRKLERRKPDILIRTRQSHHLPAVLASRILDLAGYWVQSSSVRVSLDERGERRTWGDPPIPYVTSKVIVGRVPRPVRRVAFEITAHDQGYCEDPSRGTSWTWFTADIQRRQSSSLVKELVGQQDQGGSNREINIAYNRGANPEWFTHKVSWEYADDLKAQQSESGTWIRALAPGDRIAVVPRARFPGWENWVMRVQIDVFTTCLKRHTDY
ncbi:ankyrin [Hypoxylon sp. NC1633]|nr:ankyrin [Hypoxylon sp. NC1633]